MARTKNPKGPTTHGHTIGGKYSPTYHSWQAMLNRCRHKHRDTKSKYVNRGVAVCDRWEKFENFLTDMGVRPEGTTLERVDNSKGYEPSNCIWDTPVNQARNRRNKRLSYADAFEIWCDVYSGKTAKSIAEKYGCSESLPREIFKGRTWKDAGLAARAFMEEKK